MRRRRRATDPHAIGERAAAIVLDGWSAEPPHDAPVADAEIFDLLLSGETGLAQLWTAHEHWLRSIAQTWGIEPRYFVEPPNIHGRRFVTSEPRGEEAGAFFFGEALAVAGPQQIHIGAEEVMTTNESRLPERG